MYNVPLNLIGDQIIHFLSISFTMFTENGTEVSVHALDGWLSMGNTYTHFFFLDYHFGLSQNLFISDITVHAELGTCTLYSSNFETLYSFNTHSKTRAGLAVKLPNWLMHVAGGGAVADDYAPRSIQVVPQIWFKKKWETIKELLHMFTVHWHTFTYRQLSHIYMVYWTYIPIPDYKVNA